MPSNTDLPTPPATQRKRKSTLHLDTSYEESDGFIEIDQVLAPPGFRPQIHQSPCPRGRLEAEKSVEFRREYHTSDDCAVVEHPRKRVRFLDEKQESVSSAEKSLPDSEPPEDDDRPPLCQKNGVDFSPNSADTGPVLQPFVMPAFEKTNSTSLEAHDLPVTEQTLRDVQALYAKRKRENDELFKKALCERWHKDRRQAIKAHRSEILERTRAIQTIITMWDEHQSMLRQRGKLAEEVVRLYAENCDVEQSEARLDLLDGQIELHGRDFLRAIVTADFDEGCLFSGNTTTQLNGTTLRE